MKIYSRNEKLAAIAVLARILVKCEHPPQTRQKWSTNSHAQQPGSVMFQLEVFVRKSFGAVNAGAASTIAIEEVSTLDHKLSDLRLIRLYCSQQ